MSFHDPEKNYTLILSPREVSFINKNIKKQNSKIKKFNAVNHTPYGKEMPVEDDYITLSQLHPEYPFYNHINDLYCFKVYSLKDMMSYNLINKTRFSPLIDADRPIQKKINEKPYYGTYNDEGERVFPFKIMEQQRTTIV